MSVARYTVGIDLGTSHTVVAYAAHGAPSQIALLPLPQWVANGEVQALPLLPSVRYHPAVGEVPADLLQPPAPLAAWPTPAGENEVQPSPSPAVMGRYARDLGAQVPGRLVHSAKSWLSHAGVDRTAALLPWGAPDDVGKISPVAASASYLAYVRTAWNAQFPTAPLEQEDVVLTVPASFDEGARALTLAAAAQAGLPTLRLLEEPQAAFHDWLFRHRHQLATELAHTQRLLVCDVGGGTTDLTLIQVEHTPQGPQLTRIGVGNHLMLGGDNMDLALAHWAESQLQLPTPLPAARFAQLVQRCRVAKEQLLADHAPASVNITLLGDGTRLVGQARTLELTQADVQRLLVEGFFPHETLNTRPKQRQAGIVALGLPYPADAAITRHLALFLAQHGGQEHLPDTLLLNGGVFHATVLAQRVGQLLSDWRGQPLRVLHNNAPDVAVARGAVAYALVRAGAVPELGRGIGGGSARSYFLCLPQAAGGVAQGICVLPRGTPTGTEVPLAGRTFALRIGQAVRLHLVSSVADTPWQAGNIVPLNDDDFVRLPAITTRLPGQGRQQRGEIQVELVASMTEVGTLEMHCLARHDPAQRWQLAFQLRGSVSDSNTSTEGDTPATHTHPRLAEALALIERVFGSASQPTDAKDVRQLRAALEKTLGPRDGWDLPLLRHLFDALLERARRRRRSAEHERAWLNLSGYCLRPGWGAPLDEWRIEQLWALFEAGLQYHQDNRNWSEWWTLWRRAAGGLSSAQQLHLLQTVGEHLQDLSLHPRHKDPLQHSEDDMVRLVAALERVPAPYRVEIGQWLLQRLQRPGLKAPNWWALGRLGARISLYGNAQSVVPPDTATLWLQALLAQDWKQNEAAAFAAAQIARLSGDRALDLDSDTRAEVLRRLGLLKVPASWAAMVREVVPLDEADQRRSFGEGLPPGLRLLNP